eukprot:scaffold131032_cov40-Phaeocystis_antarctica.AAC.2
MTVVVDALKVPVSRSLAWWASLSTHSTRVAGDRVSSFSSMWCGVPSSSGVEVGTSCGSRSADLAGRCAAGSNRVASSSAWWGLGLGPGLGSRLGLGLECSIEQRLQLRHLE